MLSETAWDAKSNASHFHHKVKIIKTRTPNINRVNTLNSN